MRLLAKATLGTLMLACATVLTAAPVGAHVTVGLGFGGGYYGPPAYEYCDPRSRYYDPYRCDGHGDNYSYYGGYNGYNSGYYGYGGPVFSLYGRSGFHHDHGFYQYNGFGGGHGGWSGGHHDGWGGGGHGDWGGHHHH